jgi:hypothetical protein
MPAGSLWIDMSTSTPVVLPQVLGFNLAARQVRLADVAFALGVGDTGAGQARNAEAAIDAVTALRDRVGMTGTLAAFGIGPADYAQISADALDDEVLGNTPRMPRPADIAADERDVGQHRKCRSSHPSATGSREAQDALDPAGWDQDGILAVPVEQQRWVAMTGRFRGPAGMARLWTVPVAVVATFLMAGTALAAPTWTWRQPPIAAGTSEGILGGVSCPSAGACMAVGTSIGPKGDASGSFTDSWNGTNWALESIPQPAVTALSGVSCRSAAWCIAVGSVPNSADPASNVPLALRWNGVGWSALAVPTPSGETTATLAGVWCLSRSDCVAVGTGESSDGTVTSFSQTWNGTVWTPSPVPGTGTQLSGVTCTSGTSCIAVGGNNGTPVAVSWDGTSWAAQTVPTDAGGHPASLAGVSCAAPASCVAVGRYTAPSEFHALIYRWDGTAWAQQATGYQNHASSLSSVSCSRVVCTAVGTVVVNSIQIPLAAHWNGTRWYRDTAVAIPPVSDTSLLFGVSCHTWDTCIAVGYDVQRTGAFPLAEHES